MKVKCTIIIINHTQSVMCKDCLKEICPNRGNVCLETGSYLLNYSGCASCKSLSFILIKEKNVAEEENGDETVTYNHTCNECGHLIASHEYTFTLDEEFQEYSMNCALCGYGSDTVSILPDDPREKQLF
ncbi:PREDICTED: protein Churchill-like [Amphimedon queenslandica]|uniref:Protein Churchill n=2 Tax=Amphimedon queenslandica TaxID=400682 RepID=A0AAN0IEK2_AMPQE|nr:PREDICTED: protein Churchill-like [Amphimedon queenslandica]|eukprot:XP_003386737.2 PREDICTED: protein Churchill-like [Amphimedon queenslandica]